MSKKKLLICGCSFTEYQTIPPTRPKKWESWTDFLHSDFHNHIEIINRGQGSFGQSKIVETITEELIKNNFNIDLVLVQWSGIGRGYASTELDFVERIYKNREMIFAAHSHEYIQDGNLEEADPTTILKTVSESFYKFSFTQMFLLKTLLQKQNIPYKMFWGWEQINKEIEKNNKDILNLIYDENFIRFGKHGGMSELIKKHLGKKGIIPNDFHPTTEGQKLFYDTVIKDIVNELTKD